MENEDKTEWIDRYLDGTLSSEERITFEQNLSGDPDFRLEVEAQEAVRELITSQAEKLKLQRLFNSFHNNLNEAAFTDEGSDEQAVTDQKKKTIVRKLNWGNWSYMAVAASVAILIIGVWAVLKEKDQLGDRVEIRIEDRNEAFRIPLLTWRTVDFKPVLQDRKMIDVSIVRNRAYQFHYRFTNILEIYSDKLTEKQQKISLAYDVDTKQYRLHIGNNSYPVRKTDQITPLTQP